MPHFRSTRVQEFVTRGRFSSYGELEEKEKKVEQQQGVDTGCGAKRLVLHHTIGPVAPQQESTQATGPFSS